MNTDDNFIQRFTKGCHTVIMKDDTTDRGYVVLNDDRLYCIDTLEGAKVMFTYFVSKHYE